MKWRDWRLRIDRETSGEREYNETERELVTVDAGTTRFELTTVKQFPLTHMDTT